MLKEKIEQVLNLLIEIEEYADEIPVMQSNLDSRLSDINHYIENNSLKTGECYRAVKLIHELRGERRKVNNDWEIMRTFKQNEQKLQSHGGREMLRAEINKMYDRLNKDYNNRVYKEDELKNILQGRDPDYSVFSLCGDKNDDTESSEAVEICDGE